MGARSGWLSEMANSALAQRACMPLKLDELDSIIGLPTGSNRMVAVVTSFTVNATMPGRVTV